jgi:hypothetical protein
LPVGEVAIAHVDGAFIDAGTGDYSQLFVERNVTREAGELGPAIAALVAAARVTLEAHEEPKVAIGPHCRTPHACPFFGHCGART